MWLAKLLTDYVVGTLQKNKEANTEEKKLTSVLGCILIVPRENLSVLWLCELGGNKNTPEIGVGFK